MKRSRCRYSIEKNDTCSVFPEYYLKNVLSYCFFSKHKFLFCASSITCTTCPILLVTTPPKTSLGIIGCAMVEPLCFHELYKASLPNPVGNGGKEVASTPAHNLKQGKVICSRRCVITLRFPSQTAWRRPWFSARNSLLCCPLVAVARHSWQVGFALPV